MSLHCTSFPEFKDNGLGAFTTWVLGAGMGHEGGLRLASFKLVYASLLAEAYTQNDFNRPNMVPSSAMWVFTIAQRVVLVQDADETVGTQMLGLIAHGLKSNLTMCSLGTPTAANYHTPLVAQVLSARAFCKHNAAWHSHQNLNSQNLNCQHLILKFSKLNPSLSKT